MRLHLLDCAEDPLQKVLTNSLGNRFWVMDMEEILDKMRELAVERPEVVYTAAAERAWELEIAKIYRQHENHDKKVHKVVATLVESEKVCTEVSQLPPTQSSE